MCRFRTADSGTVCLRLRRGRHLHRHDEALERGRRRDADQELTTMTMNIEVTVVRPVASRPRWTRLVGRRPRAGPDHPCDMNTPATVPVGAFSFWSQFLSVWTSS